MRYLLILTLCLITSIGYCAVGVQQDDGTLYQATDINFTGDVTVTKDDVVSSVINVAIGEYDPTAVILNTEHRLSDTQAHSDYLINNGSDTTTGKITMAGADLGANPLTVNSIEIVGVDGEVNAAAIEDKFLRNDGSDTSSGAITAAGFVGALTGNVTGNCSGSSGSCTGESATVATIAGLAPNTATTAASQPNITSVGTLTSLVIADTGTIGSASDTDIMTLAVDGTTTFSVFPVTPSAAPDANYEVANKKYVDDSVSGVGTGDLKADGTVPLTADWDAGNSTYDITAVEFKGALKGQADTVATITGLAPDTQNTYARTQYLIPYASTTTAFGEIAIGTDGQVLTSGGAGVAPSFEDAAGGGGTPDDASVSQAKLKTTLGEVSTAQTTPLVTTLPGGTYGFYPQIKIFNAAAPAPTIFGFQGTSANLTTSYVTTIYWQSPSSRTVYAQQRYVTASGEDHWIFLLLDKETKKIIGGYQAPDHPSYGNGGDFNEVQHPFPCFNPDIQEIIIVDNDTIAELKAKVTPKKSLLTLVCEEYEPVVSKEEPYVPLHTGKYLTENKDGYEVQVKELITELPSYIKVRKLKAKEITNG